jgi:hypothetical protein
MCHKAFELSVYFCTVTAGTPIIAGFLALSKASWRVALPQLSPLLAGKAGDNEYYHLFV